MPKPAPDETRDEFMERCMGDDTMLDEYPEQDQRTAVCSDIWAQERGERAGMYRRAFTPDVRDVNKAKREVTHVISTSSIDRAGDIVDPSGWQLDQYLRNPVVLIDHDYSVRSIIGRAVDVGVTEEGLVATTQFHDKGLGAEAFELVKAGMAKAWSVGFVGRKVEFIKDEDDKVTGLHFKQQELLEYSLVAVPMNPDAVMNAIKAGVSRAHLDYFFRNAEPSEEARDMPKAANSAKAEPSGADAVAIRDLHRAERDLASLREFKRRRFRNE
jgi:HK97 family phage prohead protease